MLNGSNMPKQSLFILRLWFEIEIEWKILRIYNKAEKEEDIILTNNFQRAFNEEVKFNER